MFAIFLGGFMILKIVSELNINIIFINNEMLPVLNNTNYALYHITSE